MVSSVDGIISGMSTSEIISQLIQVEAAPQTALRNRASREQTRTTALQNVNTRLAALKTAAEAMTKTDTWKAVKVNSSSTAVTASATAGTPAGGLTFDVTRLATTHVTTAVVAAPGTTNPGATVIASSGQVEIAFGDGTPIAITLTDTTAQGVVNAINAKKLDVRAALVSTDQGTVLQLSGTKSGAAAAFTLTGLDPGITNQIAKQGLDAQLTVGTVGSGGYTVSSAGNTFTNVMPGVTLTASQPATGVTVSVNADATGLADKMQAIVDAANALITEVATQTRYDVTTKKSGTLTGNFMVDQFRTNVRNQVNTPATGMPAGFGTNKALGVELDRTGKLTFNRATFVAAHEAKPADTELAVSTGLAKQLYDASGRDNTALTSAITNRNDYIRNLNDQVSSWDVRLEKRRSILQRQFGSMETALGKMKNQSSWLAGQIGSLS
jgi:flagellar hook-associated protein 2